MSMDQYLENLRDEMDERLDPLDAPDYRKLDGFSDEFRRDFGLFYDEEDEPFVVRRPARGTSKAGKKPAKTIYIHILKDDDIREKEDDGSDE